MVLRLDAQLGSNARGRTPTHAYARPPMHTHMHARTALSTSEKIYHWRGGEGTPCQVARASFGQPSTTGMALTFGSSLGFRNQLEGSGFRVEELLRPSIALATSMRKEIIGQQLLMVQASTCMRRRSHRNPSQHGRAAVPIWGIYVIQRKASTDPCMGYRETHKVLCPRFNLLQGGRDDVIT